LARYSVVMVIGLAIGRPVDLTVLIKRRLSGLVIPALSGPLQNMRMAENAGRGVGVKEIDSTAGISRSGYYLVCEDDG